MPRALPGPTTLPRTSVAVERRTVSLWPTNGSPVARPRPRSEAATGALAEITSRYRRGRAGIISGGSVPSAPASPVHLPTVPVDFLPDPTPAEPARVEGTLWSRLRTRRSTSRGRHSQKN